MCVHSRKIAKTRKGGHKARKKTQQRRSRERKRKSASERRCTRAIIDRRERPSERSLVAGNRRLQLIARGYIQHTAACAGGEREREREREREKRRGGERERSLQARARTGNNYYTRRTRERREREKERERESELVNAPTTSRLFVNPQTARALRIAGKFPLVYVHARYRSCRRCCDFRRGCVHITHMYAGT